MVKILIILILCLIVNISAMDLHTKTVKMLYAYDFDHSYKIDFRAVYEVPDCLIIFIASNPNPVDWDDVYFTFTKQDNKKTLIVTKDFPKLYALIHNKCQKDVGYSFTHSFEKINIMNTDMVTYLIIAFAVVLSILLFCSSGLAITSIISLYKCVTLKRLNKSNVNNDNVELIEN